jgi:hypothetical protein
VSNRTALSALEEESAMAGDNDPVADEPEAADEADLVDIENWPELAALTSCRCSRRCCGCSRRGLMCVTVTLASSAGAELAAKNFPVWLPAQRRRDLIPRPIHRAGLPHCDFNGVPRDAAGVNGGSDQTINACRYAAYRDTFHRICRAPSSGSGARCVRTARGDEPTW